MASTVDRGSTVMVEVTCTKRTPFGTTWDLFDPTTPLITIYDPVGTAVVSAAALTKSTTGKFYYVCQTLTTWMQGVYSSKVTGSDGSYHEVDIEASVFELL